MPLERRNFETLLSLIPRLSFPKHYWTRSTSFSNCETQRRGNILNWCYCMLLLLYVGVLMFFKILSSSYVSSVLYITSGMIEFCLYFWVSNKQPHRCDQCSMSFNVEFNLTLHKCTHNGEDPTCPVCNKKFSRVASLKAHIMLHEKEEVIHYISSFKF